MKRKIYNEEYSTQQGFHSYFMEGSKVLQTRMWSRQQNSRTWSSPPPTNTSKIHLHVERSSQNIYWMLAEDLRLLKGQEHLHITSYDKRKKKWERNQDGTCAPGRELWKRKGSCTLGSPLTSREIVWDRRRASEPQRRTQQPEWRENCTDGQCCHAALPSLRHSFTSMGGGWVMELKLWRSDPVRRLELTIQKWPVRTRIWYDCNWGCT